MKAQANEKGEIKQGFDIVPEGWHLFRFEEGIGYLISKKDGEEVILTTAKGDKKWKFPTVIDDPNDDSNGFKYDFITQETNTGVNNGEQMVSDFCFTANKPKWEKLCAAYPGDRSVFEDELMSKIKTSVLLGAPIYWKIKHSKNPKDVDRPYVNIIGYGPASSTPEKLEAELFGNKKGGGSNGNSSGAGGAKKEAEKKAAATEDEPW